MGRATDEDVGHVADDEVWFVNRLSRAIVKMPLRSVNAEGFSVTWPLCGAYHVFFAKKQSGGRKVSEMRSDPAVLLKRFYVYEPDVERLQLRAAAAAAEARKDRLRDRF